MVHAGRGHRGVPLPGCRLYNVRTWRRNSDVHLASGATPSGRISQPGSHWQRFRLAGLREAVVACQQHLCRMLTDDIEPDAHIILHLGALTIPTHVATWPRYLQRIGTEKLIVLYCNGPIVFK